MPLLSRRPIGAVFTVVVGVATLRTLLTKPVYAGRHWRCSWLRSPASGRSMWLRALALAPIDTTTELGRTKERLRRVALSSLGAASGKVTAVLVILLSTPMALSHLGPTRFGLWMAISAVMTMASFSDLGIGNGLVNAVAGALGREDQRSIRQSVASAFFMLSAIAVLIAIGIATTYLFVPWGRLFNSRDPLVASEVGPAFAVFALFFAAQLPLGVASRVQNAYQEGLSANLWTAAGGVLSLGGMFAATRLGGGLPAFIGGSVGGTFLAAALNSLVLFLWQRPWLCPRIGDFSWTSASQIVRLGLLFLVLQLATSVAFASDNFIAAHLFGVGDVAAYAVPQRLFSFVTIVVGMVLAPLWPAYAEAIGRGDLAFVRWTLRGSVVLVLGLALGTASVLFAFANPILRAWVGDAVTAPPLLLGGFALWAVLSSVGNAIAMYLNGAGVLRLQVRLAVLTAGASLALKILLGLTIGIPGLIWGTVIAYLVCAGVPLALFMARHFRALGER